MLVSEVLEKAAEILDAPGAWTQGSYGIGYGGDLPGGYRCLCAYGAIRQIDPTSSYDAINFMSDLLGMSVPSWNDARKRTQSEVVAKLREAARLAREQGK